MADLGERLRARGARVWHLYDGVLDIAAAADPVHTIGREGAEIPTPVAIESDGTERYRRMSVRERSRLRPQLLERMGWRYMSLWTIEVFTDPSSCADRIGSYLGLENHVPQATAAPHHGFLDMDVEQLEVRDVQSYGRPALDRSLLGGPRPDHGEVEEAAVNEQENAKEEPSETKAAPTDDAPNRSQGDAPEAAEGVAETAEVKPSAAKPDSAGILPNKASEDDPRRWGDESGYDHDQWLKEQKPPHWG